MPSVTIFIICMFISFNIFNTKIGLYIGALLILFNLVLYLINKKVLKKPKFNAFYIFIIWIVYALIQMLFVNLTPRTIDQLQVLIRSVVLIWFMTKLINTPKLMVTLYNSWGFATLCTIIVAWWEVLTDKHLPQSGASFYGYHKVATVAFYNPNDYAFYLIISLPIIYYWLEKRVIFKLLGLFMLISSFYFIYMNGARFILVIFFLVGFVFLAKLLKNKKIKHLLFFILIFAFVCFYFKDQILNAIDAMKTLNDQDQSIGVREFLTDSALKIFEKNPFGVGPGNVENYMPVVGFGSSVHNFWLEILVNYGVLIFSMFVIYYLICAYYLLKYKHNELDNIITPIFWATLIFIPSCVISSSIFSFNITWFLFGAILSAVKITATRNKQKSLNKNLKLNSQSEQTVS